MTVPETKEQLLEKEEYVYLCMYPIDILRMSDRNKVCIERDATKIPTRMIIYFKNPDLAQNWLLDTSMNMVLVEWWET